MVYSVFRVLGGSLLVFVVVWALVLGWWQSNDNTPTTLDLVLYLGALPLALIGGYWLLRGFIEHLKASPAVEAAGVPLVVDDDPLSGARAKTAAAERVFTLCLVDAFVTGAAGESADDLLAAIDAGQRPQPGVRLTDESGFPVFVAEVEALDTDAMTERLLGEVGPLRQLADRDAVVRSLALLDGLMAAVRERIGVLLEQGGDKLGLQVCWLVPSGWDSSHFSGLRSWFQFNYGSGLEKTQLDITLIPVANEADALWQLDEVILRANREPTSSNLTLLLGAVSAVDEVTVESWAATNQLFSAVHQDRKIPGEGAVALLLASRAMVERLDLPEVAVLNRVSLGRRDKPVTAGGRIAGKLIEQLVAGVLDVADVKSEDVKAAVLDADHRSGQLTEVLEGIGQVFEHLDPIKDCPAIGSVSGTTSPIGSLLALACARAKVLSLGAPALCISNQHELDRAVVLLTPFIAQTATESANT